MEQKHFYQQDPFRFRKFVRKGYAAFNSMHKVVNIGVVAGCILTAMTLPEGHAQDVAREDSLRSNALEIDEVTVTASRMETPLSQTAKLVTVITREQIEQSPAQSIQDILVYAANIDVVQRGGHGVQADISIRGGTSEQNVILLNGVNLSNAHTGHYSLDIPVNLSDIERIEIIHGPSALIYEAGSFSGGINIITKKKPADRLYAHVEAGMHALTGIEVRGAGQAGISAHSLSAGHDSSGGYIANSEYDIYNVLWQTHLDLPEESGLDVQLGYNNKKYGANTFYSARYPDQYEHTSTAMGAVKGEFGRRLKILPLIYWNRHYDRFELIKGAETGRNFHRNDTYGGRLVMLYHSGPGATRLGLDLRRENIVSSVLGKPMAGPRGDYNKSDARTNIGLSLEHTFVWKRWMASAGILLNHTTLLGNEYRLYPSVNLAYRPLDGLKISASWSKSTRMPTFTDLYYTTETHRAGESLRPERSESLDMSIRHAAGFAEVYLTGFLLWGRDMIDWVKADPRDDRWTSWNLTKVDTQGVEAGVRLHPHGGKTSLRLDYARMCQRSDAKGLISIYALNYLRDKFTVQLTHPLPAGVSASWFFRLQKRMGTYEKFENMEKVSDEPFPAFSTLDLRLNYPYRELNVYLGLSNLYNTFYFDRGNIPQPGFWLMGGITYVIN
ncbi:MAG: TonB-dependent receptor [Tannerellaceae bacterium]|jgi:iron complex outermembrane receptor protein|nr:TonB-dependent receptor [Tannerellaceae bacterium]